MITKSILGEQKEFTSKEAVVAYVKENLTQILDFKKGVEQKSCEKGVAVQCKSLNGIRMEVADKAIKADKDYYYIAVNTTRVLDSHDDLHVTGIWNKTLIDQQGKNYLVDTHELTIGSTIVAKEDIEMFVAKVTFASLGIPYEGSTQVLVYKFRKDSVIDSKAANWLSSGKALQASVRMQYVVIEFALDSNAPEDAESKKRYDEYYPLIANKGDFDYIPYFFIIKEAKNVRESSLVPFGSNAITGNLIKSIEPSNDTHNKDVKPSLYTERQKQAEILLNKLKKITC